MVVGPSPHSDTAGSVLDIQHDQWTLSVAVENSLHRRTPKLNMSIFGDWRAGVIASGAE